MTLDAVAVGRRIVVRHETGGTGPTGGPEHNDVVGRVLAVDAKTITIERRDGRVEDVALSSIVLWKPVPDRPLRRRRAGHVSADDLTRIASRGWPAIHSMPLGEWELRSSRGFTGRANSVAAHGSPGMPFAGALERVLAFYAEHEAPALAQVIVGSPADRAFVEAGWRPVSGAHGGAVVQVTDLDVPRRIDAEARITPTADDAWLARYGRVDDPVTARAVLEGPTTVGFVSIGSPAIAIGRVVVTGEWAGIASVEVSPAHRRHGLARRIVETSLAWAAARGADKAYLQTVRSNAAARGLYEPFGFVEHHDYHYLRPADEPR